MIPIDVTDEQIKYVTERYTKRGEFTSATHQVKEYDALWGFISEVAVCDLYGWPRPDVIQADPGIDVILPSGVTMDIKSARISFGSPGKEYKVKLYRSQLEKEKRPDYYVFCMHNTKERKVFVVGIMSWLGMKNGAVLMRVGDRVKSPKGEVLYEIRRPEEEQYVMKVRDLAPMAFPTSSL